MKSLRFAATSLLFAIVQLLLHTASFAAPPANDNYANAQTITGPTGTLTATNVESTRETGEPNHANKIGGGSIWYHWKPTQAMIQVTFLTDGSNFDTLLAVYTGFSVNSLTQVAANDDYIVRNSLLTFVPIVNQDYYIAVDGYLGETGTVKLEWSGPINDYFNAALTLPGDSGQVAGNNSFGTLQLGEPAPPCIPLTDAKSLWWTWKASAAGGVNITTAGSAIDTVLVVYTGNAVNALTSVGCNHIALVDGSAVVQFISVPDTDYRIKVDGQFGLGDGDVTLNYNLGPLNDNFAFATMVPPSGPYNVNLSNVTATKEYGEPNHVNNPGGRSVWWRWKPAQHGTAIFSTSGSDFDTLLTIYFSSGDLSSLTVVAGNDDVNPNPPYDRTSLVSLIVEPVFEYWIAVDGYYDGSETKSGNVVFSITQTTPTPTISPTPSISPTVSATPTPSQTPSPTPSPTPFDDAEIVVQNIPGQIATSHPLPVQVEMRNTGNTTWSFANGYSLQVQTDKCSLLSPLQQIDFDLAVQVHPNETYVFNFKLNGPENTAFCGDANIGLRMAKEDNGFGETVAAELFVVEFSDAVKYLGDTIPRKLAPGKSVGIGITAQNTGNTTWFWDGGPGSYNLHVVQDSCSIMNQLEILQGTVPPNQPHQFQGHITAPMTEGQCVVSFQMTDIGPGDFGPIYEVTINVANPPNSVWDWTLFE